MNTSGISVSLILLAVVGGAISGAIVGAVGSLVLAPHSLDKKVIECAAIGGVTLGLIEAICGIGIISSINSQLSNVSGQDVTTSI